MPEIELRAERSGPRFPSGQVDGVFRERTLVGIGLCVLLVSSLWGSARATSAQAVADSSEGSAWAVAASQADSSTTLSAADLYRLLFETSTQLSRTQGAAKRDSLIRAIHELEAEVTALRAAQRARSSVAPEPDPKLNDLEKQIHDSAARGDWKSFNQDLGEFLGQVGEVSEELGQQLGQVQLEISSERFRLATEGGGYIDVQIPEEVRENLKSGVMAFNEGLGRVLSDSMLQELGRSIEQYTQNGKGPRFILGKLGHREKAKQWKVIGRSVFKMGSDFEVADDELVQGDVVVVGGTLTVSGKVLGKAVAVAGNLNIEDSGEVKGDAVSIGGNVTRSGNAQISGQEIDFGHLLPGVRGVREAAPYLNIVMIALRLLIMAVLALILIALMGDRLDLMCAQCHEGLLRSFAMGMVWLLVTLFLFTILSFTLALTIIGIPVVILLGAILAALILAAYFVTCRLLGERLLKVLWPEREVLSWQSILLGMIVLEGPAIFLVIFALIFAPDGASMALARNVDLGLKFLALSLGFGCVVQSRFGSFRRRSIPVELAAESHS